MAYLEINNLTKSYDDNIVLNSFSCSLEKGETLCLIGDSGSGKTTFLRLLNFLENSDSGSILLNGEELLDNCKNSKRKKTNHFDAFGLVFQSYHLFKQYTVLENIMLPVGSKIKRELKIKKTPLNERKKAYNILREEKLKEAYELLSSMNLLGKKTSYPYQLSGGESQRVALIRALILEPKILCFDEPTSALDPKLKKEVASTILGLKKQGRTIIVVTHEMELASAVSDQIIFLEKGSIIETGTRDMLLSPQTEELKNFLSLEQSEGKQNGRQEDSEKERADGTLFSLSQD